MLKVSRELRILWYSLGGRPSSRSWHTSPSQLTREHTVYHGRLYFATIFDWLHSYKELRSGRLVGEGIRDAWAKGRRPRPTISSNDNDSMSDEAEFY